ncbi:MAG: sigma-70 family RNA polymerase sigma factor [Bacteroidales bacterium]|nr:sigma-70 family RNA polymerase sigma factor [Bacteroidales bacterium]
MKFRKDNYYIDKILNGDTNVYASLINKYKDFVFTIAVKILKNREDAEELAQDVFIKAFEALNTFKKESKYSTWLYKIAFNMAVSKTRKKKLETYNLEPEIIENFSIDEIVPDLQELSDEEQKNCIEKALKTLPYEENIIITFFYYDDKSIEEISEITNLSASNVKVKLHRIRKKLYSTIQKIMIKKYDNDVVFENAILQRPV